MARSVRVQYPGAVYHVLCRGDRREAIFGGDADRTLFLATLAEMCTRTGAWVHSYVLMSNHYHVVLETPQPNLVAGMKWFQGTYTQRFNTRHRLSGHLFQGRYKAIPIETERPEYFRLVSDYIHLNPARAHLLDPAKPDLASYPWSSFPLFVGQAELPAWLRRDRVFSAAELPDEGAGSRRRYGAWMARRTREVLELEEEAAQVEEWKQLQRGWYVGSESFGDRLRDLAGKAVTGRKRASYEGEGLEAHDETTAAKLLEVGLERLKLGAQTLRLMKKSDPRKQALAWLIKHRTVVSDEWLVEQLEMGHRSNVSRAVAAFRAPADQERRRLKERLHVCTD